MSIADFEQVHGGWDAAAVQFIVVRKVCSLVKFSPQKTNQVAA